MDVKRRVDKDERWTNSRARKSLNFIFGTAGLQLTALFHSFFVYEENNAIIGGSRRNFARRTQTLHHSSSMLAAVFYQGWQKTNDRKRRQVFLERARINQEPQIARHAQRYRIGIRGLQSISLAPFFITNHQKKTMNISEPIFTYESVRRSKQTSKFLNTRATTLTHHSCFPFSTGSSDGNDARGSPLWSHEWL
jgi:hypothetical protein